jgi:hypothetical protein
MARNKHRQLAKNFEFPVNALNEGTMPRNKRRRIADFPMSDVAADRLEAQAIEKMASRTALSMIAVLFVLVALAGAIMWATSASAELILTPIPVNIQCGIPPIPPIGCEVGDCVCDSSGSRCHYEFVCN